MSFSKLSSGLPFSARESLEDQPAFRLRWLSIMPMALWLPRENPTKMTAGIIPPNVTVVIASRARLKTTQPTVPQETRGSLAFAQLAPVKRTDEIWRRRRIHHRPTDLFESHRELLI